MPSLARSKERRLFSERLCFVLRRSSNPVVWSVLDRGGETCFSVLWLLPWVASHTVFRVDTAHYWERTQKLVWLGCLMLLKYKLSVTVGDSVCTSTVAHAWGYCPARNASFCLFYLSWTAEFQTSEVCCDNTSVTVVV